MDQQALFRLTYGLYVLSSRQDGRDNACIINTAVQVANDPVRISIAVIKGGLTHDMVSATGAFCLSALTEQTPFTLFQRFGMQSGRAADKFDGFTGVGRSESGLCYLTEAAAYLVCRVVGSLDLGTHTLFIGEVTEGEVLQQLPCCTYGYYQSHIKRAPKPEKKHGWVCSVCGYVHEGDLPEDFLCPLCRHGKEDFAPISEEKPTQAWVCSICGYVHEGEQPPEKCPVCQQGADKFNRREA